MPTLSIEKYFEILSLILLIVLSWATYRYHSLYQKEVTRYEIAVNKNTQLMDVIAADSKALIKLAKDSKERELLAQKALEEAQKRNVILERKAQEYLLAKPINKDMCISANYIFDKYIEEKK